MSEMEDAQAIADGLSNPRRDRLVSMLRDENCMGDVTAARWLPAGASQWKMATAMRTSGLIFPRRVGFQLTPLGAAVARIFAQRSKAP